jgi:hypothetical protein
MLHFFGILLLLIGQALSTSRYVVGTFESSYLYAYPIDICVQTGILNGKHYVKYSCADDYSYVTVYNYSDTDSSCSQTPKHITNITSKDAQSSGLNEFNCDGTDDYIINNLYTSCKTSPLASIYVAINVCYLQEKLNSSRDIYTYTKCNSTSATLTTYDSTGSCDTFDSGVSYRNSSSISTSCKFYYKSVISIYAKLVDCVYNNYSQLPVTVNNSASVSGSKVVQQVNATIDISADNYATDPDLCGYDWTTLVENYFGGNFVKITSYCNANDGEGFAGMHLQVWADLYSGASSSCSSFSDGISSAITSVFSSATVDISTTCSASSSSSANSILQTSLFHCFVIIILAICFSL